MLAVQLPPPHGLSKSAIYVSTEAALSTSRLNQLLETHPRLQSDKPSLSRVHSIQTPDLESQDHILRYQVPVAIERYNVGLVIIDSIAANYRAEQEESQTPARNGGIGMAERRTMLVSLGSHLKRLANERGIAIVVANQVADRFLQENSAFSQSQHPYSQATPLSRQDRVAINPLTTLDHQQRFFTGWGDLVGPGDDLADPSRWKTPALGLVWANQIAGRVALVRGQSIPDENGELSERRRRFLRVAFAAWTASTFDHGIEFEITSSGLVSLAV
jgi:DNA repair protein RAD57